MGLLCHRLAGSIGLQQSQPVGLVIEQEKAAVGGILCGFEASVMVCESQTLKRHALRPGRTGARQHKGQQPQAGAQTILHGTAAAQLSVQPDLTPAKMTSEPCPRDRLRLSSWAET